MAPTLIKQQFNSPLNDDEKRRESNDLPASKLSRLTTATSFSVPCIIQSDTALRIDDVPSVDSKTKTMKSEERMIWPIDEIVGGLLERPPSLIASVDGEISDLENNSSCTTDEESVFPAPSLNELSNELGRLTDMTLPRSETLASLRQLHVWALVAKSNANFAQNLIQENAIPTLLYLVKNTPHSEQNQCSNSQDAESGSNESERCKFLLEKAVQVLFHCTHSSSNRGAEYYGRTKALDRSTTSSVNLPDRLADDMAVLFVQCKGVEILVSKLEEYEDDFCPDNRPCLFKSIWNTLMNIAACKRVVALPEYDKSHQKERMVDAVSLCLNKVGRTMPASWLDERLFVALHNLLRTNRRRGVVLPLEENDAESCRSDRTCPDDSIRTMLADTGIVTKCLKILKRNQKTVVQNREVTALAITFLYACLKKDCFNDRTGATGDDEGDGETVSTLDHGRDKLSRSMTDFHHLSLVVPFVVKCMKAFPHSQVIQGTGCLLMQETPKYFTLLSIELDDESVNDLNPIANNADARSPHHINSKNTSELWRTVLRALVGQCWYCTSR
jgi:hypothetical protein